MPSYQCLVVCQLCHSPPYKAWSFVKMVNHLKCCHNIQDDEDSERLVNDWLVDATRGRPRYPTEVIRHFFENNSVEGLADALGFILTSPDRELYGIAKDVDETKSRKREPPPTEVVSRSGEHSVDTTFIEDSKHFIEIVIDDDVIALDGSSATGHSDNIQSQVDPLACTSGEAHTFSKVESFAASASAVSSSLPRIVKVETATATGYNTRKSRHPNPSRNEGVSLEVKPPPGWNVYRNDAAFNAWSKSVVVAVTTEKVPDRWCWRLCPNCGVPRYRPISRKVCVRCDKEYSRIHMRCGWHAIPSTLWAWVTSHFLNDSAVLTEVIRLFRDFGFVTSTDKGIVRLANPQNSSSPPKKKKKVVDRNRPSTFDELFPDRLINKECRAYFLCPGCNKLYVRAKPHFQDCKPLQNIDHEVRDVIESLIKEKRIVVTSSRLLKLMSLTESRQDLRSAVAAVLCCMGASVLFGTVMSPWDFVESMK